MVWIPKHTPARRSAPPAPPARRVFYAVQDRKTGRRLTSTCSCGPALVRLFETYADAHLARRDWCAERFAALPCPPRPEEVAAVVALSETEALELRRREGEDPDSGADADREIDMGEEDRDRFYEGLGYALVVTLAVLTILLAAVQISRHMSH